MTDNKQNSVWIVKYALTKGIFEETIFEIYNDSDMLAVIGHGRMNHKDLYHGQNREWCLTHVDALRVAEEMRVKKIASLKKNILKLENMKFE